MALLGTVGLAIAVVLLLTGGDDVAPVMIVAPEPTAVLEQSVPEMRVHVSGAVMAPGVYEMREGDRVMDAIAAAGGVQADADLGSINLALRVQDESHYHIPALGEFPAVSAPESTSAASSSVRAPSQRDSPSVSLIDLNTATGQELETLPGIGPVMAERIISYREVNGPFASVDDIENVPRIGPKTLESIRPLVTVAGSR